MKNLITYTFLIFSTILFSCNRNEKKLNDEQIRIEPGANEEPDTTDSTSNNVSRKLTMSQIATFPSQVILTGLKDHRLVSIYHKRTPPKRDRVTEIIKSYDTYSSNYEEPSYEHYMPGIDVLPGYKLLNISHYNLFTNKKNFLFDHPVLIKTLYYPSYIQDSINKQPINRDYYLVSVYDEDTNNDSIINKKDLRHFYCFNAEGNSIIQIIPSNYSVFKSQYDGANDAMYIFAKLDTNKNGKIDETEPSHVFWIRLNKPEKGVRVY